MQDHISKVWEGKNQKIGRESHIGAGRPKEIDEKIEKYLVEGLQYLGSIGWPVEVTKVPLIIKYFLDNLGENRRFKDNLPGKEWTRGLLKRNKKEISKRKPEYVTSARVKGLTHNVLTAFFYNGRRFYQRA